MNLFNGKGPLSEGDRCACMGPMFGEPLCYCEMKRAGIPLNEAARAESRRKLGEALEQVFQFEGRRPPDPHH